MLPMTYHIVVLDSHLNTAGVEYFSEVACQPFPLFFLVDETPSKERLITLAK